MEKIIGIVSTIPFFYFDINGKHVIEFTIQVDRKICIFGEIKIKYISNKLITFHPGEKIETYGKVYPCFGALLQVSEISKLTNYHISL